MKPKVISFILFILAVVVQLIAQISEFHLLDMISKPVLMPSLIAYVLLAISPREKLVYLLTAALFLSWLGDVFLMFQNQNAIFFILGLVSFLLAHLGYIVLFSKTSANFKPKTFTYATAFLLIIYGMLLLMLLWGDLGEMRIPVILYMIVIMIMGIAALFRSGEGSSLVLIGAMLFIASDSLLAYNKFGEPFIGARFWIMATYIMAQFSIVAGMVKSFNMQKQN